MPPVTPGVIGVFFSKARPPPCASPSAANFRSKSKLMPLLSADSSVACRNTLFLGEEEREKSMTRIRKSREGEG